MNVPFYLWTQMLLNNKKFCTRCAATYNSVHVLFTFALCSELVRTAPVGKIFLLIILKL